MTTLKFTVTGLLEKDGDTISGPMSSVLFAKEMCKHNKTIFNRLARVSFTDRDIFQHNDGDYTHNEILLIGHQYKDDLKLSLWINEGSCGTPVALAFKSDREIIMAPDGENAEYERTLSKDELKQLFDYVFDNTHILDIPEHK